MADKPKPEEKKPLTLDAQLKARIQELRMQRNGAVGQLLNHREMVKSLEEQVAAAEGALREAERLLATLPK